MAPSGQHAVAIWAMVFSGETGRQSIARRRGAGCGWLASPKNGNPKQRRQARLGPKAAARMWRTVTRCPGNQRSTRPPDFPPRFEINVYGAGPAAIWLAPVLTTAQPKQTLLKLVMSNLGASKAGGAFCLCYCRLMERPFSIAARIPPRPRRDGPLVTCTSLRSRRICCS
jgi:hypothetical protein